MATTEAMKRKRTKNDRKFDRILKAEEEGRIKKSKMSRSVQKMFQNRLAVIGLMVFGGILLTCLLAPRSMIPLHRICVPSISHHPCSTFSAQTSWDATCLPAPCTAVVCPC